MNLRLTARSFRGFYNEQYLSIEKKKQLT